MYANCAVAPGHYAEAAATLVSATLISWNPPDLTTRSYVSRASAPRLPIGGEWRPMVLTMCAPAIWLTHGSGIVIAAEEAATRGRRGVLVAEDSYEYGQQVLGPSQTERGLTGVHCGDG